MSGNIEKLYSYQKEHANNIVRIIKENNAVLDASDTGTGKTYTAVASCELLNINPFIICPKSIISQWSRVCKEFNVKPLYVVNYELIQRGKIEKDGKHIMCPYLSIEDDKYIWTMPKNSLFIFDEVHKCSEMSTNNGKLLLSAKETGVPIMMLSATIADRPEKFYPFFYVLNFLSDKQVKELNINFRKYMAIMEQWIMRDKNPMARIHQMLYPKRATRMRIDVLGDLFPETQITATPYSMGKRENLK